MYLNLCNRLLCTSSCTMCFSGLCNNRLLRIYTVRCAVVCFNWLLSTLVVVLNSRDQQGKLWLPEI